MSRTDPAEEKSTALSQKFISDFEPHRDRFYALALSAAGDATGAENLLHRAVHEAFHDYPLPASAPFATAFESRLSAMRPAPPADAGDPTPAVTHAMPAPLWARIYAAVQIEAAKRGGLPAGHSLLTYDPLLAPRKTHAPAEEPIDGLGLSPVTRFVLVSSIALVIAITLTIVLTTRRKTTAIPTPPATLPHPTTRP